MLPDGTPGAMGMANENWKGSNGGGKGWNWDNQTDTWAMPEIQSKFLDWLLTDPREPETKRQWCALNDLHEDTPKRWKRDKRFLAEWDRRAQEMNISVDRVQSVVDSLHKAATNGDVKAASLYLQYIQKFTPVQRIVTEASDTKDLSDAALMEELRMIAGELN